MNSRDLVVGAFTGYNFKQIAPWVNSLDRSGFQGLRAVVAYNVDYATLNELAKRGYAILCFEKDDINGRVTYPNANFSIVVDRFLHYFLMLDNPDNRSAVRYVVATDMKDVIFQTNPSDYLDGADLRCQELVVSSEAIAYQHEPWGASNLLQSFGPHMYEKHKTNTILNCGVLAGKFDTFMGLCKSVYLVASGTVQHVPGGGGPDQAALNLLLSTPVYEHITEITTHKDAWACQMGTTMDPSKIEAYRPFITEPLPKFNGTQVVNLYGTSYAIVHQWDRVPEVREAVERLYA